MVTTMPNVNDIEYAYGRIYRYIKPNSSDPGTWRLSIPEEGSGSPGGGGGGGGTGTEYDFDAVDPIQVDMTPGVGLNPTRVVTFLDIQSLDSRV